MRIRRGGNPSTHRNEDENGAHTRGDENCDANEGRSNANEKPRNADEKRSAACHSYSHANSDRRYGAPNGGADSVPGARGEIG